MNEFFKLKHYQNKTKFLGDFIMENQKGIEKLSNVPSYEPFVDIYETEKALHLQADMPGVDKESIQVDFEKNILTIKAKARQVKKDGFQPIYQEYAPKNYERSFSVSNAIDSDNIEATYNAGQLDIVLPFKVEQATKKIQVKIK